MSIQQQAQRAALHIQRFVAGLEDDSDDECARRLVDFMKEVPPVALAELAARHGYVLVPEEPTEEMLNAVCDAFDEPDGSFRIDRRPLRNEYCAMTRAGKVKPE